MRAVVPSGNEGEGGAWSKLSDDIPDDMSEHRPWGMAAGRNMPMNSGLWGEIGCWHAVYRLSHLP